MMPMHLKRIIPKYLKKIPEYFFQKKQDQWPCPEFDENDQPHFLFIITPPYSGSTALASLINTSHRTMILQRRGEGQWLVPGLCEKDRWDADKEVNYLSIKATWLSTYQQAKRMNQAIDVVIEKSPPNMVRIERLSNLFRNHSFLANNRDPYANCASILYRQHNADNLNSKKRKEVLSKLTQDWIQRSLKIKELISGLNSPLITYENFCSNPSAIMNHLNMPDGVLESINLEAHVKVKDYEPQSISNQNERQIRKLTDDEIEHISELLSPSHQLLEFFGYQLMR